MITQILNEQIVFDGDYFSVNVATNIISFLLSQGLNDTGMFIDRKADNIAGL